MAYDQEANGTKGLMLRRLQEVEDEIGDLEPRFKDLKAERRVLRIALGQKPGPSRQRKPKVVPVEYSAAE